MLVLSRKEGESLIIGEDIKVTITAIDDSGAPQIQIELDTPAKQTDSRKGLRRFKRVFSRLIGAHL